MLSTFQEAREQEESSPPKKVNVLLLSSEWWSRKGGISTLNRVLATQLAKHPLVELTVFLLECSEEERKEAVSNSINIVKAPEQLGFKENVLLCFPPNDLEIDIVIGHGAVLGAPAKIIRDNRQCKWIQVVHTMPKQLGMFKTYQDRQDPIKKSEEKHQLEVKFGEMADSVVGVGPKLTDAFRCYLRWCKKNPDDVINLTPGIFNMYSGIQHALRDGEKCRVLVFGRADEEDFILKGFDIASKAVAQLPNTTLIFAGACDESLQLVANRFLEGGISPQNLDVRGFLKSTQEFIQLFCEVDLALLPSRSDGFGLTALEALSAGLPVLVSRNTGFGEALSKIPFGSFYVIDSEDPSVWASAIEQVWKKDRATRLQETDFLRTWYGKKYNWESQCNDLVSFFLALTRNKQTTSKKQLQPALSTAQTTLTEQRLPQADDFIIPREEIGLKGVSVGDGTLNAVEIQFRGHRVAVKRMKEFKLSPHNRQQFKQAMADASYCCHPNLLQFICATNENFPLLVNELPDTCLHTLLLDHSLSVHNIITIALDVAEGLNFLHRKKIIHRNVRSTNVLLWREDEGWRAKLGDNEIAHLRREMMRVSQREQESPKVKVYHIIIFYLFPVLPVSKMEKARVKPARKVQQANKFALRTA